jgi:endonuclease YncB( thermonuclease family)
MGDIGPWGRKPFRSRNDRLIIGGLIVGNLLLWGFIPSWSGILSLSGIFAPSAAVGQLTGRASVIDGDTIDVAGHRIRLHGIDVPESYQACRNGSGAAYACGATATSALTQAIGARLVSCQPYDRDRYGRRIARCFAGDTDLASWLMRRGYAVAYWRYSWRYVLPEIMAWMEGMELWQGDFERPED